MATCFSDAVISRRASSRFDSQCLLETLDWQTTETDVNYAFHFEPVFLTASLVRLGGLHRRLFCPATC